MAVVVTQSEPVVYKGLKVFISVLYSKKMKVLESLISMIQKFPYGDPTYANLHDDLDRIRGKFKQVCPPCVSSGREQRRPRGPWADGRGRFGLTRARVDSRGLA